MSDEPKCACVSHDPFECARRRDIRVRDAGDVDEDMDPPRRECECCCHDDYTTTEDWDDDWANVLGGRPALVPLNIDIPMP